MRASSEEDILDQLVDVLISHIGRGPVLFHDRESVGFLLDAFWDLSQPPMRSG